MDLLQKPILSATLGDFVEAFKKATTSNDPKPPQRLVYGIAGLANIAGCSIPTAQKIKNSGKVRYIQNGRKLIFVVEQVLEDLAR